MSLCCPEFISLWGVGQGSGTMVCWLLSSLFPFLGSPSPKQHESPALKGLTGLRWCYLQLRAVPRQGDPCSDLKLPPALALHLLAALHTWSLWTGRQHGPNVFRLGWGTGCWAPRTALFPTSCANSHFLSLQGGSDFLLCKPGMLPGACMLPLGPPHGSARLHGEHQPSCPSSVPTCAALPPHDPLMLLPGKGDLCRKPRCQIRS